MDVARQRKFQALGAVVAIGILRQTILERGKKSLEPFGPRWLAVALVDFVRGATEKAGVTFHHNTEETFHGPNRLLDPARQYLVCWHPHGAFTFCAAFFTAKFAAQSTLPEAPGPQRWFVGIADLLFRFPVIGEYLVLNNCRPVGGAMSEAIMKSGSSYGLQPGGIAEQVRTNQEKEELVFPPKLGFARLAVQHGTPLIPIYCFGENQVFTTYKTGKRITNWLHKTLGIALPMMWGRPVEVGEARLNPSDAEIESLFARYVLELQRLFDEHKERCLPAEVARRGLKVEWRGHTAEELEALLESERVRMVGAAVNQAKSKL